MSQTSRSEEITAVSVGDGTFDYELQAGDTVVDTRRDRTFTFGRIDDGLVRYEVAGTERVDAVSVWQRYFDKCWYVLRIG